MLLISSRDRNDTIYRQALGRETRALLNLGQTRQARALLSRFIEADGGTITLQRSGSGLIIRSRRIQIEGFYKDLAIVSKTGKPTRSFTLRGSKWQTCAAVFD